MRLLMAMCLLASAFSPARAQSTLTINNTFSTRFQTNTLAFFGTNGNTRGSQGSFYYEVLTAPSAVTTLDASLQDLLTSTWSDTGVSGTNGVFPGREIGLPNAVALNWAPGSTQSFVVVGWSVQEGTTWAEVSSKLAGASLLSFNGSYIWQGFGFGFGFSGFLGATTVGQAVGGEPGGPGSLLFGATLGVTSTTQLYPVDFILIPEPATLALAGLGAAALLTFLRRTYAI
jgi:hypothetical protein